MLLAACVAKTRRFLPRSDPHSVPGVVELLPLPAVFLQRPGEITLCDY
jgi:hypothetical protein